MSTPTPTTNVPTDVVIYRQELCTALGVVSETVRRWMADGKLPNPDIRMSQKTVGWRLSTLHAAGINIVQPVRPGLEH